MKLATSLQLGVVDLSLFNRHISNYRKVEEFR
jgi:hypothetical protein